eukprot:Gb_26361 [translate_table: standard]
MGDSNRHSNEISSEAVTMATGEALAASNAVKNRADANRSCIEIFPETFTRAEGENYPCCSAPDKVLYQAKEKGKRWRHWVMVGLSCLALSVGASSNILLSRFYFVHGGSHRWLSTWLQSAGWPFIVLMLLFLYIPKSSTIKPNPITLKMLMCYCALGVMIGVDNLLFAWGFSYLPASTTSLLISSQLAFNSIFSVVIVRHKFTAYSINSVVLLVLSSVLLACESGGDRPEGVTPTQYIKGFLLAVAGAALNGLLLPLLQLTYKMRDKVTFPMILEMQVIICASGSALCIVAMVARGDFSQIHREALSFDIGQVKYFMTLIFIALSSQLLFLGNVALIFMTSALLAAVFTSLLLPMTGILAILIFHDTFTGIKAMSIMLAVWGFTSYLYGGYKESKRHNHASHVDLPKNAQAHTELPSKHSSTNGV